MRQINEAIKTIDNGDSVRFLDMFDTFCSQDDEFVREYYNPDLLHLATPGYVAWAETMGPVFNEMLQSMLRN